MRWWSSSKIHVDLCTSLLSRTTSPRLFPDTFLSPELLCQHKNFSISTWAFLYVSVTNMLAPFTLQKNHTSMHRWEIDLLPCCFIVWQFILWICWCDMPTRECEEHNHRRVMLSGDISAVVNQCIAFDLTELYQLMQERVWLTGLLGRKESTWSLCGYYLWFSIS